MSNARTVVADAIKTDNPTYVVDNYPSEPAQVTNKAPYVDVYTARITPNEGGLRHEVEVHVYVAQRGTEAAESQLEDARDDVLISLQRILAYQWEAAERVTFQEQFSGYKITGWLSSLNEYARLVRAEGA